MIDQIRGPLRKAGDDPFGDEDSDEISKAELDSLLIAGEPEAAGVVHAAIEEFSQEFAVIIQRFLKLKEWKGTQRIAVGGGFRERHIGELVTGRTAVLLKGDQIEVDLVPIHNHPDEAGLIGAVHLALAWMFKAFDAVLAIDIGGTNIRAGVVKLNLKKSRSLSKAKVWKYSLWRHGDEEDVKREQAISQLGTMLKGLIGAARKRYARTFDAFALIFVPSNATWPSLTSPAVSHNFSTWRNNSPSAFKWRLRKSLIVRKAGGSSATIITKSFRSQQALAMRRDEYSPLV